MEQQDYRIHTALETGQADRISLPGEELAAHLSDGQDVRAMLPCHPSTPSDYGTLLDVYMTAIC